MKYGEEEKKMFRDKDEMKDFADRCRASGFKVLRFGYMPVRTYRNFGFKYGVVYRKPIRERKVSK